jgi:Xaa-Pro aminopeptidase
MSQSSDLLAALTPMNISPRADKIRAAFPDDVDALLVTHLTNVRYVTGYTGSNAMALITRDAMMFITDGRYKTQSAEELGAAGVKAEICVTYQGHSPNKYLEQIITGKMTVGLEADTLSWAAANSYQEHFAQSTFVPTSGIVEQIRAVKEPEEVDRIRAACRIADDALAEIMPRLKDRMTEKEFATLLDRTMIDFGAEAMSFDTIVANGPNGAMPHAQPSDRVIEPKQMTVIDFGCVVDGYCSDMTRTVSVGEPDERQQEMFEQVLDSQRLGREAVKPGVASGDIDNACRGYLDKQGVAEFFAHGTGHGVGLDVHELPYVRVINSETLKPGHIITVEPGIYYEGFAGVRIEDTLAVTEDGAEVLTTAPKTLVVA